MAKLPTDIEAAFDQYIRRSKKDAPEDTTEDRGRKLIKRARSQERARKYLKKKDF